MFPFNTAPLSRARTGPRVLSHSGLSKKVHENDQKAWDGRQQCLHNCFLRAVVCYGNPPGTPLASLRFTGPWPGHKSICSISGTPSLRPTLHTSAAARTPKHPSLAFDSTVSAVIVCHGWYCILPPRDATSTRHRAWQYTDRPCCLQPLRLHCPVSVCVDRNTIVWAQCRRSPNVWVVGGCWGLFRFD